MSQEYLIIDCVESVELCLNENDGNSSIRFRGKFQECDSPNKNKRVYPKSVLEGNVQRLDESIKNGGLVGELDHASDSIIHFQNASHKVTKLWWEGNNLMGEAEILPTPMGKVLRGLLESGVRVGISSRGVGNGQTNAEGIMVIGESYKLITFDVVADPSTYSAYQKKIKKESKINNITTKEDKNVVKNENTNINNISIDIIKAAFGSTFKKHIDNIRKG